MTFSILIAIVKTNASKRISINIERIKHAKGKKKRCKEKKKDSKEIEVTTNLHHKCKQF